MKDAIIALLLILLGVAVLAAHGREGASSGASSQANRDAASSAGASSQANRDAPLPLVTADLQLCAPLRPAPPAPPLRRRHGVNLYPNRTDLS